MKGFKNILGQNVVSYFGEKLPYSVQSVLFSPDCGLRQTMGCFVWHCDCKWFRQKSFFINIGLWLFPQIKLKKFCPSTSQHSATKWGWLVQRSCFGQLAIPRTILEISLVSLLGKRCFSSTRNSLSLTILLHEHICPIFDFFVIFWPIMTWCTQLHADLFFCLFHI